jgi:hypothetical protein
VLITRNYALVAVKPGLNENKKNSQIKKSKARQKERLKQRTKNKQNELILNLKK